jgi:hypothetical protein
MLLLFQRFPTFYAPRTPYRLIGVNFEDKNAPLLICLPAPKGYLDISTGVKLAEHGLRLKS